MCFKMDNQNFYDILNVSKHASPEEIKKAYRELAKQYHPDKNKAPDAAEKFKMISLAHEVLSNPTKKQQYDDARRTGCSYDSSDNSWSMPNAEDFREWFKEYFPEFAHDDPFSGTHEHFQSNMRTSETKNFSAREQTKEQNSTRNTEFGRSGFSTSFGGRQKRKPDFGTDWSSRFCSDNQPSPSSAKRSRQEPCSNTTTSNNCNSSLPKDPVIERHLEVSLDEIATGTTKKLKIKRKIYNERGGCTCTQEEKLIEITIKPGWKAGTKLTYPNLGDQNPGREPADIAFILKDKPHALFSRDSDNNLLHTANVTLKKALLGVSYCIQGLNGQRHDVNVKDIVYPGFVKRYPGEGLPLPKMPSKRGDLIVTFNIEFPTFLSWDQRRVLSDCLPN